MSKRNGLIRTSCALNVANEVGALQSESEDADHEPVQSGEEREQARDEKDAPDEREDGEDDPEDFGFVRVDERFVLVGLENPFV